MTAPIIHLTGVTKEYQAGRRAIQALRGVDLIVEPGEWVTILGPSGCGKSTLLNILSGIDRASGGSVEVAGVDLRSLSEEELARWRGRHVGIIFQFFQLMPTLTALENVLLPMELVGQRPQRDLARELLERVGVGHLADHLPNELSGGEQQRVAIARALANDPPLLLADEPTGNLDSASGARVLSLLAEMWKSGKTLVLVTHDRSIASCGSRVIEMRDGRIVADRRVAETVPHAAAPDVAASGDA
ncbi:ABC transporter ATP-binding protein [Sphaerobacter sp.]|uniref:ABC transporter ATP-binding protein n=1 Tax=Sphaerobacter sp. TaxID=2099654 RepID=UPI001D9E6573|nr:ABC transporter ATP-binding protein [Sphaerobacter sp.]MBX5443564.1 ABC transporter ATP-binding protein [Sphaerobacter sp.]